MIEKNSSDEIYSPKEDSFLLENNIKKFFENNKQLKNKLKILDVGTGSGILAKEASKYGEVIAVDINPKAIQFCKKKYKNNKNITFFESDLFSNINDKFDLIIFNPPYLPMDEEDEINYDLALFGGKNGWEIIQKFLINVKNYLNHKGKILLLFSSLTNKKKIENILKRENYIFNEIDLLKMNFERLFIYEIRKH